MSELHLQNPQARAFDAGRRAGLAVAALALSIVSFVSLLGGEKAILAIVLAALALRGGDVGAATKRLSVLAISIGSVFLVTIGVVLVVFWEEVIEFITLLQRLS